MVPGIKRAGRVSLQGSFDRDVYLVLKKLEERTNDGKPFKSVYKAYEAIKNSNSSLGRQKKQPLENAIDRVLQFRKQETADDESDSEAAIEEEEAKMLKEEDRFLLNRQMIKHWNVSNNNKPSTDDPPRATKKRRLRENGDEPEQDDGARHAKTPKEVNGGLSAEASATEKSNATQKKATKPRRYTVEQQSETHKLGGLAEVFSHLKKSVEPMMNFTSLYEDNHVRRRPGILISGPPGSGKRSMVKNLASELEIPLISISACFEDSDRMEKNLAEAFEEAARLAPSIMLIEQLDQYMSKPDGTSTNESHRHIVWQFTRQMHRIQKEQPRDRHVLAIGTTSRIVDVDPAVLKTGLFESIVQVKVPDRAMREDIIKVVLGQTPISEDVDIPHLAKLTHGYVGADLVQVVTSAQELAVQRTVDNKTSQMLGDDPALNETKTGVNSEDIDLGKESGEDEDEDDEEEEEAPKTSWKHSFTTRVLTTLSDFKAAIKDFTPSLRKEGFTAIPDVTWDSVGALRAVRDQLHMSIIGPIKNPEIYQGYGLTRPGGVLLWGPPGCGKTLVAQAVANAAQASFILISGPELLNKYVGESERGVRELFQRARSSTPCILFFDEIDSLVPKRDNASTEAGTRVVNALLTELDGARDRTGVYVIGTTNRPDMIDEAMLRPGRLSERLFVDLPTVDERVDILKAVYRRAHSPRIVSEPEISLLESVAKDPRCENFSGADLEGLRIKAAQYALARALLRKDDDDGSQTIIAPSDDLKIGREDWDLGLANIRRSVKNPESYRMLNRKLNDGR